jgi:hypothetical protein
MGSLRIIDEIAERNKISGGWSFWGSLLLKVSPHIRHDCPRRARLDRVVLNSNATLMDKKPPGASFAQG